MRRLQVKTPSSRRSRWAESFRSIRRSAEQTPWGAKLTSRWLRRVMWTIFKELKESGAQAEETLPAALCERLGLPSRMEALEAIHFPSAGTSMTELMSARTPAHRRLIFEELWYLELGLELKRRRLRERQGTAFVTNDQVRAALKQVLPFKPTAAQKRVLGEIVDDMRAPRPMRRLLQGDVGSGKTIVALEAALVAIENGYQVAMMVPTEILATQHYLSARKLLRDAISPSKQRPYRITLLTGSLDDRMKRDARGRIFRGETDLAIGTHALVEEKVDFENLGLVIVDEQHRFGVQQRFKLMRKPSSGAHNPGAPSSSTHNPGAPSSGTLNPGAPSSRAVSSRAKVGSAPAEGTEPDVLVMTATPIPRTLALTIYGDLEASVLDELPPGRTPIVTRRMPEERADEVWDFVRKQVEARTAGVHRLPHHRRRARRPARAGLRQRCHCRTTSHRREEEERQRRALYQPGAYGRQRAELADDRQPQERRPGKKLEG